MINASSLYVCSIRLKLEPIVDGAVDFLNAGSEPGPGQDNDVAFMSSKGLSEVRMSRYACVCHPSTPSGKHVV